MTTFLERLDVWHQLMLREGFKHSLRKGSFHEYDHDGCVFPSAHESSTACWFACECNHAIHCLDYRRRSEAERVSRPSGPCEVCDEAPF